MAFLSDIKDIIVTFGLDPNIQVEQGIKIFLDPRVYSSLALGHEDDIGRVKPEYDNNVAVWIFGSSPNMTLENFYPNKASTLWAELAASESALVASCWRVWSAK